MAVFKAVVRFKRPDGFYPVYIRVTHQRKAQYIKTDKMVDQKGVDKSNGIKDPYVMKFCANKISRFVEILNKQDISSWTVDEVVNYLKSGTADICFSDYAREYQSKMIQDGHARNARTYELAYENLERYIGTTKVMFSHLTSTVITRWIESLSHTARAKEQYPVCVRQIYKKALLDYNDYDAGIIRITNNPWPKVKIPKADKSEHRAISMEDCRAFFYAPIPESDRKQPLTELGHDVAMMILCLAGINTIDLYHAEKKHYHDNIIGYERRKTRKARTDNAWFEIRVPGIRQICEKVLNMKHEDAYSGYTFRHTWATIAQNECGATLNDVDFGLNHAGKTRLARTYVKVDFTPAWELNEKVIEKIFFTEDKSSANKNDEPENNFFRFSAKQMIKGTLYFKGKILSSVEDIGFNNIEEVIAHLMKDLPDTIPPRSMVLIRIENKDKGQKQDYTRMVR